MVARAVRLPMTPASRSPPTRPFRWALRHLRLRAVPRQPPRGCAPPRAATATASLHARSTAARWRRAASIATATRSPASAPAAMTARSTATRRRRAARTAVPAASSIAIAWLGPAGRSSAQGRPWTAIAPVGARSNARGPARSTAPLPNRAACSATPAAATSPAPEARRRPALMERPWCAQGRPVPDSAVGDGSAVDFQPGEPVEAGCVPGAPIVGKAALPFALRPFLQLRPVAGKFEARHGVAT